MVAGMDRSRIEAWMVDMDTSMRSNIRSQDTLRNVAMENMETVDAKISASDARTDTKFAELLGELRLMNQRLDHVERSTSGMRSTVIGTGIGVVAVVIAVMAYGAQWFGLGMDAQQISGNAADSAARSVAQQMQPQIDTLKSNYSLTNQKLDEVLRAVGAGQRMMDSDGPGDRPVPMPAPNQ